MSEQRLIDACSFIEDIETENVNLYLNGLKGTPRPREISFAELIDRIKERETVDAVEVVRCRFCEHHHWEQEPCHGKTVHYCDLPHMKGVEVFNEFFCYYGKRKAEIN